MSIKKSINRDLARLENRGYLREAYAGEFHPARRFYSYDGGGDRVTNIAQGSCIFARIVHYENGLVAYLYGYDASRSLSREYFFRLLG